MARPPSNAPRSGTHRALSKVPKPPKSLTKEQIEVYTRYGEIMVEAGTLTATDLPALEDAARVRATLDEMYRDADASRATIAAFSRLHKELLVQLGLTPAARRAVQRADAPPDAEGNRLRDLIG